MGENMKGCTKLTNLLMEYMYDTDQGEPGRTMQWHARRVADDEGDEDITHLQLGGVQEINRQQQSPQSSSPTLSSTRINSRDQEGRSTLDQDPTT